MGDGMQGLKPLDETGQGEVLPEQAPAPEPLEQDQPAPPMLDRRHTTQPKGEA